MVHELDLSDENIFGSLSHLGQYLSLSIEEIITSKDPIIRALGMLDSRLGKRRLTRIEITNETELVQRLWQLRCQCEGLDLPNAKKPDLTAKIKTDYWSKLFRDQTERGDHSKEILQDKKRANDIGALVNLLSKNALGEQRLTTPTSQLLFAAFREAGDAVLFIEAIKYLLSCTKLLDSAEYVKGVMSAVRDNTSWQRSIFSWRPRTHNAHKQFASLVRHLFAQYDVPLFMDKAWLKDNRLHQTWYKQIGSGKNIRSSEGLPVELTKKAAHHFLLAPESYSIEAAIRYGQILALGGEKRLADAILDTRLTSTFVEDNFWQEVLKFFISNPMLDLVWINPMVDFIWHQKFEDRIEFTEAGVAENIGPPQPKFSMHRRTVHSLIKQINDWHARLGRGGKNSENVRWHKCGINELRFIEGSADSKNMKVWRIYELLSGVELVDDGRQLKHCVASYIKSCARRSSSIWSMELKTEQGIQ